MYSLGHNWTCFLIIRVFFFVTSNVYFKGGQYPGVEKAVGYGKYPTQLLKLPVALRQKF